MRESTRAELTVRGLIIGAVITLVFTAANVYFGLKAGLTFSTSIPAAVISMAILRGFRDATIQENNIVQTVASAAGTLSSIIFVLPGLIMIGWWTGFPFWISFAICALGGVLGVMYSIPLRRALVTTSDLPYPEGVACAAVLQVGTRAKYLESQGPFRRRGRDRCISCLALAQIGKARRPGPRRRDGGIARAQSGQGRHAADYRTRYSYWYCRAFDVGVHAPDWMAARLFRQCERARRTCDNAHHRRRRLCRVDELLCLGRLRLHGGIDRFVQ